MNSVLFNYENASKNLRVPRETVREFEKQARNEFPGDDMLAELHVLRAVKSYANEHEAAEDKK